MGHDHAHAASRAQDRARLRWVLVVTLVVLVVEVVGAFVAGSLALLADAAHMATDAGAIVLALAASYLATRPSDSRSTFGWHRAEILAAALNALVLLGVCVFLVIAGVRRLFAPETVDAGAMIGFALVGLAANAVALAILSRGDTESLNLRGALLEVAGDLVGSLLAVVAGLVILVAGFDRADALASLAIAALIAPRAIRLLRDATAVLLERTPPGLELDDVRTHLLGVEGVTGVHDLHAWTITSGLSSLSAHVTVHDQALAARGIGTVLDELSGCVAEHFDVQHATFQVEPESHREHEDLGGAGCD